jgi:hypothetical protein
LPTATATQQAKTAAGEAAAAEAEHCLALAAESCADEQAVGLLTTQGPQQHQRHAKNVQAGATAKFINDSSKAQWQTGDHPQDNAIPLQPKAVATYQSPPPLSARPLWAL